jgi:cellulose biosynthesis protein BcsQ
MSWYQVIEWLKDFSQAYSSLVVLVTTVIGFVFGLRTGFWSRVVGKIRDLWNTDIRLLKARNARLTETLDRVRDAFDDDNNLGLRNPVTRAERYDARLLDSIPILLFANLKGGVGKTTIAANLADYFERSKGERVLAIDLDHQGSLSSMLLPESAQRSQRPAEAVRALIDGRTNDGTGLFSERVHIRHSQLASRLIECDDAFSNFETRLLLEWLIGDRKDDIRYNLARVLHSHEVQNNFDRVIIDAPPRMTTGLVNALCASTHLVVPFVLDNLSAERDGLFLRTVRRMRGQLFPHLELAGVVGTLKGDGTEGLRDTEQRAILEAERGVSHNWGTGQYVFRDTLIPRKQSIADTAGIGVDPTTAAFFAPLGRRLFKSLLGSSLLAPNRASQQRGRGVWEERVPMKVSSLLVLLSNFEAAAAAATGATTPSLAEFRRLFLGHESQDVALLVKALLKQRDARGRGTNSSPLAHLCESLNKLETCLRGAGGNKAADDLAKLLDLLEGCGQRSVGEFVSEARQWLTEASQPRVKTKPTRGKKALTFPAETLSPTDYTTLLRRFA